MAQNLLFPWLNYLSPDTTTTTTTTADTNTFIGCNIEEGDGPIERHVLETVGSYGFQLNRIIDVLSVIVQQANARGLLSELAPEDAQSMQDFIAMADAATAASETYLSQTTERAATKLIQGMHALGKSQDAADKALYRKLKAQLDQELFGKDSTLRETAA